MRKMKKWIALALAAVMSIATMEQPESVLAEELVRAELMTSGICKSTDHSLYFTDSENNVIYKKTGKEILTVAGIAEKRGYQDGKAEEALFSSPWDITKYKKGFVISDTENHVIRFLKNGKVKTLAGKGKAGWSDRKGKNASFNRPTGLAVGKNGELYIADTRNNCIRVMDKKGNVKTFAGKKQGCADGKLKTAKFNEPIGLYYHVDTLYVADSGNHRICQIRNGKVKTIAGSQKGVEGDVQGKAGKSRLSYPQEICYTNGGLYSADTGNSAVKRLKSGKVTTEVEAYSLQKGLVPSAPRALCVQDGYLYIGDIYENVLVKIKLK